MQEESPVNVEVKRSDINETFYKEKRIDVNLEGDIFQIIKGAVKGDNKSLLMFALMCILIIFIVIVPAFIGIVMLLLGNAFGWFFVIFAILGFVTILRNLYISYKRNKF